MGWPFAVAAPSLDSGFASVPISPTSLVAGSTPVWLMGANFANPTSAAITVTLQDGSGAEIVPTVAVPSKGVMPFEWAFLPSVGLQWVASGAGLIGKVWGYQ